MIHPPTEPLAIIGIGCRMPGGADSPAAFWELLLGGVDAVGDLPPDRFDVARLFDPDPTARGRIYTRWGGFLRNIDQFDPAFFGISPREALHIDPQHRLLLETTWEAFEDAGVPPERAAGASVGVFIGISTHDYGDIQMYPVNRDRLDHHSNTGTAVSIAANRLSYFFDFRGPSLTVDTACSSSLTALHLACESIRAGECTTAIVGGVHIMLTPEPTMGFCRATMLSPTGRCRAFDSRADGYVRSEGAGVVILKPLSQAIADGDIAYAVIRGTAMNQDGRSSGLTVPSAAAHEAMLRRALGRAGLDPADVQYVEAHGTGTPVGDPIEASAIGAVMGAGQHPGGVCAIGSVKTNIGHLEAASGMAGLIKTALMLRHRRLVPTVHFEQPNPRIDLDALRLRVVAAVEDWPAVEGAGMAGVNSFGFGGANAHVLMGEAPAALGRDRGRSGAEPPEPARAEVLTLSARSADSLRALAREYIAVMRSGPSAVFHDFCAASVLQRSHHPHRVAVVGASFDELVEGLEAFLLGDARANVAAGAASSPPTPLAFVFSGMGPQWWGMARGLIRDEPIVRDTVQRCDAIVQTLAGWSVLGELAADEGASRMRELDVAQVCGFAVQAGLVRLLRSWGIVPDVVLGHSAGEITAAWAAGVHDFEATTALVHHRSRLQVRATGQGRMLAAGVPPAEARPWTERYGDRVALAAVNSPSSITLSGDADCLTEIERELQGRSLFARFLPVDAPFHSARMDPLRRELAASLEGIEAHESSIDLVSTVTGQAMPGRDVSSEYWWRNLREGVQFGPAIQTVFDGGCRTFLEIGPHPVLAVSIRECLTAAGSQGAVLPTLRRELDDRTTLLRAVAALYVSGRAIDWARVAGGPAPVVALPTYAWDRSRHWFEPSIGGTWTDTSASESETHPLLQRRIPSAVPAWEAQLPDERLAWVEDHRVQGATVFPAAGYIEAALAARMVVAPGFPVRLTQVEFSRALFLNDERVRLQSTLSRDGARFEILSAPDGGVWTLHASGTIGRLAPAGHTDTLEQARTRCTDAVSREACYTDLGRRGLEYGPAFRGLTSILRGTGEAIALVTSDGSLDERGYHVHPALLDAAFQLLFVSSPDASTRLFLPVKLDELTVYGPSRSPFWAHARVRELSDTQVVGDVAIFSEDGTLTADVRGLRCHPVDALTRPSVESLGDWLYEQVWHECGPAVPEWPADAGPVFTREAIAGIVALQPAVSALDQRLQYAQYYDAEAGLNDAALSYMAAALRDLGSADAAGFIARGDLEGRVTAPRRKLLERSLAALRDRGWLADRGDGWVVAGPTASDHPAGILATLRETFPGYGGEADLIAGAGPYLARNLSGETAGVETLLSGDMLPTLERFYTASASMQFWNLILADAARTLASTVAGDRPLRMLEVGAGTGGSTGFLLEAVDARPVEFTFSDLSPVFVQRAADRWHGRPSFRARVLDLETDPEAQGFAAGSFDVIVAANVLHATADLGQTLQRLRGLLAPGGALVLLEITRRPFWLDAVFGQTDGWWSFRDHARRPDHPLLPQSHWLDLLRAETFDPIVCLADRPPGLTPDAAPGQTLFIARAPDAVALPAHDQAREWIVMGDDERSGADLCARLARLGVVSLRPQNQADALRMLSPDGAASIRGVVYIAGRMTAPDVPTDGDVTRWVRDQAVVSSDLAGLADALSRAPRRTDGRPPELWIVTTGAREAVGAGGDEPGPSTLVGTARAIMVEQPDVRCRLLDLDPGSDRSLDHLAGWLVSPTGLDEDEVAIRGDRLFGQRLARFPLASASVRSTSAPESSPPTSWRAEIDTPGALQTLVFRSVAASPPGPDDVAVRIEAAGLNFRDVMLAMGMIPGLEAEGGFGRQLLGLDAAGVVTAVGEHVTAFSPGDRVVAIVPGAFAAASTTRADLVAPCPGRLTAAQAAAIPCVFVTALYALEHVGRLAPGERVLIHAATGGVGLAAVQIARRAGATVFATAGSAEKRAWLRAQGVEHVMDSRSLAFADEVMDLTHGEGVDVVLNSLAGEALTRSLALLRPYGRFLEIGKRDIYQDSPLGLLAFRKNLSFSAIDLDRMCAERPALVSRLLRAVMDGFERGDFEPLPMHEFEMPALEDAMRFMAQARHIGKVVLTQAQPPLEPGSPGHEPLCRADATYVVSGGLGGFGLTLARWLVRQGARHLVLFGRRGLTPESTPAIEALRAEGAQVDVVAADVASEDTVSGILNGLAATHPPVRGVFHAAMVLDDGPLSEMDTGRVARVMGPKAAGAWNLHRATLDLPLDYFVLFSSASSVLGNQHQLNYCAANAFLDGLVAARRRAGRVAHAINWGVLGESGYVSRHAAIGERLEAYGYRPFSDHQAIEVLEWTLRRDVPPLLACRIDWRRWAGTLPSRAASPRFRHLVPEATGVEGQSEGNLGRQLRSIGDGRARAEWVEEYLRGKVGKVLGLAPAGVDVLRPLVELGADSLTGVELTTALAVDLGVEIPLVRVLQGASIKVLGALILDAAGAPPPLSEPTLPLFAGGTDISPVGNESKHAIAGPTMPPRATAAEPAREAATEPAHEAASEAAPEWTGRPKVARRAISWAFRALTDIDAEGLEHLPLRGPCIVAVNHLSYIDVPLVMTLLPRPATLLAADYLSRSPFSHWFLQTFGRAIYVARGSGDRAAIDEAVAVLRSGGIVALGPEGTRSRDGRLGQGLTGVAWMAVASGAPVVPVAAWGQERLRRSWSGLRRAPIHVRVGAPFLPGADSLDASALRASTREVMLALAALLPPEYRGDYVVEK